MNPIYRKPDPPADPPPEPRPEYRGPTPMRPQPTPEAVGRSVHFWLTLAVGVLLFGIAVAVLLAGCGGSNLPPIPPLPTFFPPKPTLAVPSVTATPAATSRTVTATPTRTPTALASSPTASGTRAATATPTGPVPTPPTGATPFPVNSGKATFRVHDAGRLPLSPTRDNLILFVLTAETDGLDPNQPVLEVAMRGTSPEPCLSRSRGHLCGNKAGLVPRWTGNIAWDRTLDWSAEHEDESLAKSCGDSTNYHQRLALGPLELDGSLLVTFEWDHAQLSISTPVDSWTISSRKPHTARFGRLIVGAPWDRAPASQWRSWLWRPFSAGVLVDVVSWGAVAPVGTVTRCP